MSIEKHHSLELSISDAPCMEYLPTFTTNLSHSCRYFFSIHSAHLGIAQKFPFPRNHPKKTNMAILTLGFGTTFGTWLETPKASCWRQAKSPQATSRVVVSQGAAGKCGYGIPKKKTVKFKEFSMRNEKTGGYILMCIYNIHLEPR